MTTFKLLVVDQFCGLTPAWLADNPTPFEVLTSAENLAELRRLTASFGTQPTVIEVDESWTPRMAQTSVRANLETGLAEIWKYKWDSSG